MSSEKCFYPENLTEEKFAEFNDQERAFWCCGNPYLSLPIFAFGVIYAAAWITVMAKDGAPTIASAVGNGIGLVSGAVVSGGLSYGGRALYKMGVFGNPCTRTNADEENVVEKTTITPSDYPSYNIDSPRN